MDELIIVDSIAKLVELYGDNFYSLFETFKTQVYLEAFYCVFLTFILGFLSFFTTKKLFKNIKDNNITDVDDFFDHCMPFGVLSPFLLLIFFIVFSYTFAGLVTLIFNPDYAVIQLILK